MPAARTAPAFSARTVRDLHTWIGMLIAPSVLFFALTGAIQLFGLHEVREGRGFQPPAWVQALGQVHKNQKLELRAPRQAHAHEDDHDHDHADDHERAHGDDHDHAGAASHAKPAPRPTPLKTQALKWVFLVVALGLAGSTGFGIWMGLTQGRRRRLSLGLLIAGALIPVLILAL